MTEAHFSKRRIRRKYKEISVETGSRARGKPARMELQWLNLLVKKTSKMLAGAFQDKGREKFRKSRRLQFASELFDVK